MATPAGGIADMLEKAGFACARMVESDPERGKSTEAKPAPLAA